MSVSPSGHGEVISEGFEPPASSMSGWRALRCSTRSAVQPVGVEPTSIRVSDGYLAARSRLEGNALYGNRTRLHRSTGGPVHQLHHRAVSKDGRSRTLWTRVGTALLSQEHVPMLVRTAGFEPAFSGIPNPRPLRAGPRPECVVAQVARAIFLPPSVWEWRALESNQLTRVFTPR